MHLLLDKYLCNKYPKIFADRNKPMSETCMCWGFSHKDGWFYLIDSLCNKIQYHIDSHNEAFDKGYEWAVNAGKIEQVVALQVKEKFSGLRFYYRGGDEKVRGMVDLAEDLSYNICEICGVMNNSVGRNPKGWHITTCETHAASEKNFQVNGDKKLEKIWKQIDKDSKKQEKKEVKKVKKKVVLHG